MVSVLLAASVCGGVCFAQRQVVYAQPVVKAAYVAPVQYVNVWYGVGQNIQLGSLVAQQLRSDREYQGYLAWKRQKQQTAQQSHPAPPEAQPLPNETGTLPPPDSVPSQPSTTPEPPGPVARPATTVAQKCASCHGTATPRGQFFLDGVTPINAESLSKAVEKIMLGEMPPAIDPATEQPFPHYVPLTALEKFQLIEDLIGLKLQGEG